MDTFQIIFLAFIQGVTEFLPISSSAHLILPTRLLSWEDQGLGFDIVVHLATLMAVVFYMRSIVGRVVYGFVRSPFALDVPETRLAYQIAVATIPVVIAGLVFKDAIATWARHESVIATTTLVFGLLLGYAYFKRKEKNDLYSLSWVAVLLIGMAQAMAIIPGTSRSGVTITMALFLGLTSKDSARFSFLLSIPVILGACLILLFDLTKEVVSFDWTSILIAFMVAALTAFITLGLFMKFLETVGMLPFVVYRLLLALLLFALFV